MKIFDKQKTIKIKFADGPIDGTIIDFPVIDDEVPQYFRPTSDKTTIEGIHNAINESFPKYVYVLEQYNTKEHLFVYRYMSRTS